jgi:PleD family two-component response regulator
MTDPSRNKILMVDDQFINIQMLKKTLGELYEVHYATSGKTALAAAARMKPDLILLDVIMPELDGFAICRRLKADPELWDIPVIFLTGLADATDMALGLELGAVDYITKPFNPAIVKMRVRNHLELSRQRGLLRKLHI